MSAVAGESSSDHEVPGTPTTVQWLEIVGERDRWRSIGLVVTDDGLVTLMGTSLRIVEARTDEQLDGIVGWALSGATPMAERTRDIDGLDTDWVSTSDPAYAPHPLGASALDHVVVTTPDLERTSAAIARATGCELKRIRELGAMRQGFHRIGPGGLIVELVERADAEPGPAAFWGLVFIVDDIDVACDLIGPEYVSAPKDAVQPGRRIATVRSEAGLGLPVALMTR